MSADLALQGALLVTLTSNATIAGFVGDRVLDRVDPGETLPYIHMRGFQIVEDGADCVDGLEIYADLDVWSSAVGKPQASRIASAAREALHRQDLVLAAPWSLVEIEHRETIIGDEDGLLVRARMSFRALVERT